MAIYTINTNAKNFFVENISLISTDYASIYKYEVTANDTENIVITLVGDHINTEYILNGVTTAFTDTVTIAYNTSLIIKFALGNSGNPGIFNNTILTVENQDTTSTIDVYNFELERQNDSPDCCNPV